MANQAFAVDDILPEYHGSEAQLAGPELYNDPKAARKVGEHFNELRPVIQTHKRLTEVQDSLEAAREMACEDSEFTAEAERPAAEAEELEEKLAGLLTLRDPYDSDDIVMKLKSGTGGEETALFAGELARMYQRCVEEHSFTTKTLGLSESDLGGMKNMTVSIRARAPSHDGAWSMFKFEGGIHHVQRVPVTESQGRIQTSATGALVCPEPDKVESIQIGEKDPRIDVYHSSGKGDQDVSTTGSAVRLTRLLTGLVVTCQKGHFQIQNKARAMQILAARLQQIKGEEIAGTASDRHKSQVRNIDHSERIHTYNFLKDRVSDHRISYKAHNLDSVLGGDMDDLLRALHGAERAEYLEAEWSHARRK